MHFMQLVAFEDTWPRLCVKLVKYISHWVAEKAEQVGK